MQVIGVAGHSDTGKTTHVERLVPALRERGRVATVKSIHHDVDIDDPGTDTHRHRQAGAERVVGVTPAGAFQTGDGGKRRALDREGSEAAALRRRLLGFARDGIDYAVVEGFRSSLVPVLLTDERVRGTVGGHVVGHVDDLDLATQVERVDALAGIRTPAALAATSDEPVAVGTDAVAADRDAAEWTAADRLPTGDDDSRVERVAADLRTRTGVSSVGVVVRPPVTPTDRVAVHVVVTATGRTEAVRGVEAARERLGERWAAFANATADRILVR
ncbi:MAG: molybdopterin-guanine dinucleotide biosynthesis protein B [Haloferacaceae archaeon]